MNHLFIIGAQRSGSTYLYHLLQNHPQINMAKPAWPEPKFFLNNDLCRLGRAGYEKKYFNDISETTRYLGEKSTSYIESSLVGKRIAEFYPDARILIILRNPVIRAYSNYLFSMQNGLETLSFEEAIAMESNRLYQNTHHKISVNPFAYRQRGYYMDYIEKYLHIFSLSQIYILIFEELVDNPDLIKPLYKWLEINHAFIPHCTQQVFNAGTMKKNFHTQAPVLRNLSTGYADSLERLEQFLNRKIDVWRKHWNSLQN